jgi:hypothetical protein
MLALDRSAKELQVCAKETEKLMVKIWRQNVTTNPVCDDEKAEFICSAVLPE